MQGMGWLTTEELVFDDEGRLRTHAPSTYKIPVASDVPADFRVALHPGANRAETIYRSKAVGEPPLMLANAVFCALADAVHALAPRPAGAPRRPGDARSHPARLRGRSRAGAGLKAVAVWRQLAEIVAAHGAAALVAVHRAQGSTPREAGAALVVRPDGAFHGTIGGGRLEWEALREARAALAAGRGAARFGEHVLGPDLGQCCGGRVTLRVETFDRGDLSELVGLAEAEREGRVMEAVVAAGGRVERADCACRSWPGSGQALSARGVGRRHGTPLPEGEGLG